MEYISELHPLQWITNHWAFFGILAAVVAGIGKTIKWRYEVRKLRYEEKRREKEDKIAEITRRIEQLDEQVIKKQKIINVTQPEQFYLNEIKEDPELIREAIRRRKEKTNHHFHQNPLIRKTL